MNSACYWLIGGLVSLACMMPARAQPYSGASLQLEVGSSQPVGRDPVKIEADREGRSTDPFNSYYYSVRGAADLERGLLKGYALAQSISAIGFTATIFDELTFVGEPLSTFPLGVVFEVEGSGDLDDIGDSNREFSFMARLSSSVRGTNISRSSIYEHQWGLYTLGLGGSEIWRTPTFGDVEIISNSKGSFHVVMRHWLDVPVGAGGLSNPVVLQWILDGVASASASAGGGFAVLDVANTGRAGLVVPQGYSWTSASGVFLTQPVPEPQTALLASVGLAALVLAVRYRTRRERASG